MSFILLHIISFFVSAYALKFSLGVMGQPARENKYGTALTVAGVLTVGSMILGLLPFYLGLLVYPILWLAVVNGVYHIGMFKSMAVAGLQFFVRIGLMWLVGLIVG